MLLGTTFTAKFSVMVPAINPGTGAADPTPEYTGSGNFITTNTFSKAT